MIAFRPILQNATQAGPVRPCRVYQFSNPDMHGDKQPCGCKSSDSQARIRSSELGAESGVERERERAQSTLWVLKDEKEWGLQRNGTGSKRALASVTGIDGTTTLIHLLFRGCDKYCALPLLPWLAMWLEC